MLLGEKHGLHCWSHIVRVKPRALAHLQELGALIKPMNPDSEPSVRTQSMLVGGEIEGSSLQATAHPSIRGFSYGLQVLEASEFYQSSRRREAGSGQQAIYLSENLSRSQDRNPKPLSPCPSSGAKVKWSSQLNSFHRTAQAGSTFKTFPNYQPSHWPPCLQPYLQP